ncbi:MAG: FMN-binding glutamate synthase family protein, partial [Hyphomonas sp.]|nr:FMN-binding glutamate synthase family protein [Hyphomonas sp.]
MSRYAALIIVAVIFVIGVVFWNSGSVAQIAAILGGMVTLLGITDLFQKSHTLWRNYPLISRIRWIAEELRPFIRSYVVESETEGRPFNHEQRAMIYRRAKDVTSVEPFGSHLEIDKPPYEWLAHSMGAVHCEETDPRVRVGAPGTAKPYSASVFNISAMSFGSLGAHAIEALSTGAKMGGFYHDTGEGAISRYHRKGGADLVWELGSGYFGCRAADGGFDPERFRDTAADPQVKMIEIKLSQG